MYKFHRNSCDLVEENEWIRMAGNITKVQREEEGGKGRKYGDTVTVFFLISHMQTGHLLALLLENASADYYS